MRLCHSSSSAANCSSRAVVSRETATSASARARSAARSGAATCSLGLGIAAGTAHMSHQQRQRGRGHAIDTARLSNGAWAMLLQLVTHLVGEAWQGGVVDILPQDEVLITAVRLHIGSLAAEIDVVFRVDLELGCDLD